MRFDEYETTNRRGSNPKKTAGTNPLGLTPARHDLHLKGELLRSHPFDVVIDYRLSDVHMVLIFQHGNLSIFHSASSSTTTPSQQIMHRPVVGENCFGRMA